jgi:uncharacterized protein (TIGR02271 family)
MEHTNETLTRMSETKDFEVAKDDPDIRGWEVSTANGQDVGRVTDLIVDPAAMKVRQIEVALSGSAFKGQSGRKVIVPVASADLDRSGKTVILHGLTMEQLSAMPEYGAGWKATSTPATDYPREKREGDARRLTRAEEELRIGKRAVQAGEVRVGKHVETEHVRQPVTLEKERVTVERRPVTGEVRGDVHIGDQGEVVVPIMEEEAVVDKRAVVKEELVIGKERVAETETVEADVRKEEFDIDRSAERARGSDIKGSERDMKRGGR